MVMILLSVLPLVGCASPFDHDAYDDWTNENFADQRHRGQPVGMSENTSDSALHNDPVDAMFTGGDAGPEAYVTLALQRNPSIRAAQRNVQRLAQRIPQATSLDDPMLQLAPVGEQAETAAGQVDLVAGVSQKLPFPGKLDTRGRIASQDVAMAAAELEQTKLDVTARTLRAYWSLYAAARDIEVTESSRGLLVQFKQIAEAKYAAGTAQQQDVLRASVELSNLDRELLTFRQKRSAAEAMLNRMLDRRVTAPIPDPPPEDMFAEETTQNLQAVLAAASQSNPALSRLHEQIEQYRQRLKLARLNRWPDLNVGVTYAAVGDGLAPSSNGDDQLYLNLGINLPIWAGRLEAAEREAHQGIMQSLARLQAEHNRVDFDVREAFDRMQTHEGNVVLLRDRIVPEAKQAVDASLSQYSAGDSDFLSVIDNWRRMLQFEQMLYDQRAMFQQAAADLREAVGEQIEPQMNNEERRTEPNL